MTWIVALPVPFIFGLERQLLGLHGELAGKTYRPGRYRAFTIYEGKPRQISAASFRDRVVHHALTVTLNARSGGVGSHDDHARLLGQLH